MILSYSLPFLNYSWEIQIAWPLYSIIASKILNSFNILWENMYGIIFLPSSSEKIHVTY